MYEQLCTFANAATELADLLESDINKGADISIDTVLALDAFKKSVINAANVLDQMNKKVDNLN
jgi:hypothetical protein